ncbi:hypothetical protein HYH03_014760 [Edaphochlamys debaryana]|uniref:LRAT domain-containing protein n=1 Tax=Edaphochlamys debaryana TaxID=47281 RepID=A0A835XTF4_9CHLO|nr:hypothetical protein HYH03_014760 [Edaphochlamys debaryana]|eukprot:KAG2486590.1 hypothetical protein HYH03_014760 [Edaphochlamys debaryana]
MAQLGGSAPRQMRAHIGHAPLVGVEWLVGSLPGAVSRPLLLHSFVALGSSSDPKACLVVDFLPERPTDPTTALALASGAGTQGVLRVKQLKGWVRGPALHTRRVAPLVPPREGEALLAAVEDFNRRYDTRLRLGSNDCHHYACALVAELTGRRLAPEELGKLREGGAGAGAGS